MAVIGKSRMPSLKMRADTAKHGGSCIGKVSDLSTSEMDVYDFDAYYLRKSS
jgi:hypothetical protein